MTRLLILICFAPVFLNAQDDDGKTVKYGFSGFAGMNTTFIADSRYTSDVFLLNPEINTYRYESNVTNVQPLPGFQFGIRYSRLHKRVNFVYTLSHIMQQVRYDYSGIWWRGIEGRMKNAVWRGAWLDLGVLLQLKSKRESRVKFLAGLSVAGCFSNKNSGWMIEDITITYFDHSSNTQGTIYRHQEYTLNKRIENLNYSLCGGLEFPVTGKGKKPIFISLMYYNGISDLNPYYKIKQSSLQVSGIYYLNL